MQKRKVAGSLKQVEELLLRSHDQLKNLMEEMNLSMDTNSSFFLLDVQHKIHASSKNFLPSMSKNANAFHHTTTHTKSQLHTHLDGCLDAHFPIQSLSLFLLHHYHHTLKDFQSRKYFVFKEMNHSLGGFQLSMFEHDIRSIEAELSILQEIVIRLAYSYEAKLTNEDEAAINSLKCSDLTGYLHHIVDQLAVNRKIDQFLMLLKHLPCKLKLHSMASNQQEHKVDAYEDEGSENKFHHLLKQFHLNLTSSHDCGTNELQQVFDTFLRIFATQNSAFYALNESHGDEEDEENDDDDDEYEEEEGEKTEHKKDSNKRRKIKIIKTKPTGGCLDDVIDSAGFIGQDCRFASWLAEAKRVKKVNLLMKNMNGLMDLVDDQEVLKILKKHSMVTSTSGDVTASFVASLCNGNKNKMATLEEMYSRMYHQKFFKRSKKREDPEEMWMGGRSRHLIYVMLKFLSARQAKMQCFLHLNIIRFLLVDLQVDHDHHNSHYNFLPLFQYFLKKKSNNNEEEDEESDNDDVGYLVSNVKGEECYFEQTFTDLKDVETELLLVASRHIFNQPEVDTFEVIHDIWRLQEKYLKSLVKLVLLYYKNYSSWHNCLSNREQLRSVILELCAKTRPSFDLDNNFKSNYLLDTTHLQQELNFILHLSDEFERDEKVRRKGCGKKVARRSTANVGLVRTAIENAFKLFADFHSSSSSLESVTSLQKLRNLFYHHLHHHYQHLPTMGQSYSSDVVQQLFENNIFEDSIILTNQIEEFKKNPSNQPLRKSVKEKHKYNLTLLRVVIETVVVRSRLMTSAWEGEVLGEIYRLICKQIRAEETNLFVRPISFELSSSHVNQSQFLTLYTDDNDYYFDSLDRFTPRNMSLAATELRDDESNIVCNSLATFQRLLSHKDNSSLREALTSQQLSNQLLISSIAGFFAALNNKMAFKKFKIQFGLDEHNNEEKEDDGGGYGGRRKVNPGKEGLISIQLQKTHARNTVLQTYREAVKNNPEILKNKDTHTSLKRDLFHQYLHILNTIITIINYNNNINNTQKKIASLITDYPYLKQFFKLSKLDEDYFERDDKDKNINNIKNSFNNNNNNNKDNNNSKNINNNNNVNIEADENVEMTLSHQHRKNAITDIGSDNNRNNNKNMKRTYGEDSLTNADNNSTNINLTNNNNNNNNNNDHNNEGKNNKNNDSTDKTSQSLDTTRLHDDDDDDDEDENLDNDPQFKKIIVIINEPWTLYSLKQIKIIFSKIISFIRSPFSSSSANKNKDDLDSHFAPTSHINKLFADWLYLNQSMFAILSIVCSLATIPVPNQNHQLWGSELTIVNEIKALKNTFLQLQNKAKPTSSSFSFSSSSSFSSFINVYKDVLILKLKVLLSWKLPKTLSKNQKLIQNYLSCSSLFENLLWGTNIRRINFNNVHYSNNMNNQDNGNKYKIRNFEKNNMNNSKNINVKYNKLNEKNENIIDYYNYHTYTNNSVSTSHYQKPPFDNLFQWMEAIDCTPLYSPSHAQIRNDLHLVFSCLNSQQHTKANAELLSLNLLLQELQYLALRCNSKIEYNNYNNKKNKNNETNNEVDDNNENKTVNGMQNNLKQNETFNGVPKNQSTFRNDPENKNSKNKLDKVKNIYNDESECSTLIGYRYIAYYLSTFDQLEHWKLLWAKNKITKLKNKNLVEVLKTLRQTYKQDVLTQLSLQLISALNLTHFYGGLHKKNNDKNNIDDEDDEFNDDDDDQYWTNSLFRNKIGITNFKEKQISFLHETLQQSLLTESLWQVQQHKNLLLRHYHYNDKDKNNIDITNGSSYIDYDIGENEDHGEGDDEPNDGGEGDSNSGGEDRVVEMWKKQAKIYKLRLDKSDSKLAILRREMEVRMNFLLADQFGDLILETSKLQSKVAQLEKLLETAEERSRREIKVEMMGNLKKLFVSLAQSQIKENQFRYNYINDLHERFANCCSKTYQQIQSTIVNNRHQHHLQKHLSTLERLMKSEREGEILKNQLMLMKGMGGWRKWCDQVALNKQLKQVRDSETKWREMKHQAELSAKNASVVREVQLKAAKKTLIGSVQCNKELRAALECESKNASKKAMSISEELKNEREEKEEKIKKIKILRELLQEKEKVVVDLQRKLNSIENKHHVMLQKWANEVKEVKRKLKMEKKAQALDAAFQSKEEADDVGSYGPHTRQLERPQTCRVKSSPIIKTGTLQRNAPMKSRCKSAHVRFEKRNGEGKEEKDENFVELKSYNGNERKIESAKNRNKTTNHNKKQDTANTQTSNLTITTLIAEQLIKHSPPPDQILFHRTVQSATYARPAKKTLFKNQKSAVFSSRSIDGDSKYF